MSTSSLIETRGIERVPDSERHSSPREIAKVFFGSQMSYGALAMGALPIMLGLDWLGAISAVALGNVIGSVMLGLMALMGRKTGTNSTVTSVAFFGLRGRYIGSFITQVIDLGYFAAMIWVSTPPLLYLAHSLIGVPQNNTTLTLGLCVVALVMLTVAVLGHATVVAWCKFTSWASLLCFVVLIGFSLHDFHSAPDPAIAPLPAAGYWATWALVLTIGISNSISYAPFAGDYSRYTPQQTSSRSMFWWVFAGIACGSAVSCLCGTVLALCVHNPEKANTEMLTQLPLLVLIPIVVVGFVGNVSNAAMLAYNGMLDLQAILFRLSRFKVALIFSLVGLLVGYIGLVEFRLADSIVTLGALVTVLVTPWTVINVVGYLRHWHDLQVDQLFAFGQRGSRYWFSGGLNLAALFSWLVAVGVGLLFSNTALYAGPLAQLTHGIDLSFISAALVGGLLYLLLDKEKRR